MLTSLRIQGMSCGGCRVGVERALRAVDGVEEVRVSLEQGSAEVRHAHGVAPAALVEAVQDAGFEASLATTGTEPPR